MLLHEQRGLRAQWLHVFTTLRCNLRCRFCSVSMDGKVSADFGGKFSELSAKQWGRIFFRTQRNVLFGGGEPFLHREAIEILFAIPPQKKVTLFSNTLSITDEYIQEIAKWGHRCDDAGGQYVFNLAYHPPAGMNRYIDCVCKMKEAGIHSVQTAIREESVIKQLREVKRRLQVYGFPFIIRQDAFGCMNNVVKVATPGEVFCRRRHLVIAPDGQRYPCIRHMLTKTLGMENMVEENVQPLEQMHKCQAYGTCTICDLERFCKIATTREEAEGPVVRKDFFKAARR